MASRYPEIDKIPLPSPTIKNSTVLEEFDKTEKEINSHFNWLHQIMKDRNKAILEKLKEKRAEFVELEADRVGQIEEIETMKQQLLSLGVKSNQSNLLREQTLNGYDDAIKKLRIPIHQQITLEYFTNQLQTLISAMDLKFVENNYRNRFNPTISIDRDSILQSIDAIKLRESQSSYLWGWRSTKEASTCKSIELSKLALDSITNHIFTLNRASNNILVFEQDGTLIACFGEEFKNLTDLCIDNDNKFLYVLDRQNCVYKFNITTYQLLRKKENEVFKIKNEMYCLDVHNNEIYVGTGNGGVYIFNSEFHYVRSICTNTIICLDVLCREEYILISSVYPDGLNIYTHSGDFIRKITLSFSLRLKDLENFQKIGITCVPFQFSIDKTDIIIVTNPFEHCFDFTHLLENWFIKYIFLLKKKIIQFPLE